MLRDALGRVAVQPARLHREPDRVLVGERLDPERRRIADPSRPVGPFLQEVPARDADHHHGDTSRLLHELLDQVQEQGVGLLEVLEDHHDGPVRGDRGQPRQDTATNLRDVWIAVRRSS